MTATGVMTATIDSRMLRLDTTPTLQPTASEVSWRDKVSAIACPLLLYGAAIAVFSLNSVSFSIGFWVGSCNFPFMERLISRIEIVWFHHHLSMMAVTLPFLLISPELVLLSSSLVVGALVSKRLLLWIDQKRSGQMNPEEEERLDGLAKAQRAAQAILGASAALITFAYAPFTWSVAFFFGLSDPAVVQQLMARLGYLCGHHYLLSSVALLPFCALHGSLILSSCALLVALKVGLLVGQWADQQQTLPVAP